MPYQIVKTVKYNDRPNLGYTLKYIETIDFNSEIQPYYPNLTSEVFNTEMLGFQSLVGDLPYMDLFFNNTDGLFSYDYEFIDPYERLHGVIQTIVYKDKDAYDNWQAVEHTRAMNSLSKLEYNLGENSSFDASNFLLDGTIRTDTSTGISKDLAFGPFLICKHNMLRKTVTTIVHSIIE